MPIYISRTLTWRNLHQLSVTMSRVSYFSLRTHTGTGVSHSQHRKKQQQTKNKQKTPKRFGRNSGEWTKRVEISKERIPSSRRRMNLYRPTPGFKGRIFELWILLNRWELNFCLRSSPLQGLTYGTYHMACM